MVGVEDDLRGVAVDAGILGRDHVQANAVQLDSRDLHASDVVDAYSAMVHDLVVNHYCGVTRYTTSGFLRAKLGEALSRRGVAPHIYESAKEAQAHLRDDERI